MTPLARLEAIGARLVEAESGRDPLGEKGEAAGNERGIGAIGAHGRDQGLRAGRESHALGQYGLDDRDRQAGEQSHALTQRRLERELAAHGPFRDLGDRLANPGEFGELVDAFLADHRRIHIGEEQAFAPSRLRLHDHIGAARARGRPKGETPIDERLGASGKHTSAATPGSSQSNTPTGATSPNGLRRQRRAAGAGDEGRDMLHRRF